LRNFLNEFKRYKLGIAGIAIIVFFTLLAVLAPVVTQYNPIYTQGLAAPYSIPSWARAFPQYSSYPVNSQILKGTSLTSADLGSWRVRTISPSTGTSTVSYAPGAGGLALTFNVSESSGNGGGEATLYLSQTIAYPWSFTCHYSSSIVVTPLSGNLSTSQLNVTESVTSVRGKTYELLAPATYTYTGDHFTYVKSFTVGSPTSLTVDSDDLYSIYLATGTFTPSNFGQCGIAQGIFSGPGNVTVSFTVSSSVSAKVLLSRTALNIQGRAFGLLGTDNLGRDVWSQFVYGARVSLIVGLVASIMAVLAGTLVGVAAGYLGGLVDEALMRFTDFMLILPFLPFLLIVITIISVGNVPFPYGTEFLIIIVIAVFSWEGIARVIRSQVLSLKTRQFIESSRALGANDGHIIWSHILPNVTGLIYANMALTVPGAILTEAAVTFLGFGDPSVVSWGSMVSDAQAAVTSTVHSFVWWWFLPPGLAIALLSMAFLFFGFALDAVLNPRLRKR
jgi:peptide/nickel transport system permease protein